VANKLNDLTGSQWLYWTNTIYETNFPPDRTHKCRKVHGAMKPPELMAEIIKFFTKKGEEVLDPFAGVGGTLLGAILAERRAMGIELNPAWVAVFEEIRENYQMVDGAFVPADNRGGGIAGNAAGFRMVTGDCVAIMKALPDEKYAAIITDPPYGCSHGATGFKRETNFNMVNPPDERDFGNAADFQDYLQKMREFGREAYRVLQPGRYLVLLVGDRYHRGEYYPLGYRVAEVLQNAGFKWKGLRIWWNKATQRPLKPYAVNVCFIPNITHQNMLIMRKEAGNEQK